MKPKYTLATITKKTAVNPGEVAIVDLFISGHGAVEENKLVLVNSNEQLLTDEPGEMHYIPGVSEIAGNEGVQQTDEGHTYRPLGKVGTHTMLDPRFFSGDSRWIEHVSYNEDSGGIALNTGEKAWQQHPPIRIKLNISEDAPPGNYNLPLILTYATDNEAFQARQDVSIRVNNLRQQLEPWPTWTGIAAAVIALFSLMINAISVLSG